MVIIIFHQSLSNSAMHEHRCLENIRKLYKNDSKCDNQQQQKAIFEASMVSTNEGFTDNIPMSPSQYVTVKNLVEENHSINFWKHWMSNIGLLSAG